MDNLDLLSLTRQLIVYPSITPHDAGCQKLIGDLLTQMGFSITTLPYQTAHNLWAIRGETKPCLVFAGHTDVVPVGDIHAWQFPPFDAVVHDGKLYGRGTADMKGALAAMLIATREFLQAYPQHRGSIGFLITSAEEGPAHLGTPQILHYLAQQGTTFDWCVVGEPTCEQQLGDTLKNGRRGSLSGQLTIQGKQGHIAYPQLADNPIHAFAPVLTSLINHTWDNGNAYFQPTQLQISNIHAGTGAGNVIPGTLEVSFNLRYAPCVTASDLMQTIENLLKQHKLDFKLEWTHYGEPFLTTPGTLIEAITAAIQTTCHLTPQLSTSGGTSDARYIAKTGAQVVEFGLRNDCIHQVDEHLHLGDLQQLQAVYYQLLIKLLGEH